MLTEIVCENGQVPTLSVYDSDGKLINSKPLELKIGDETYTYTVNDADSPDRALTTCAYATPPENSGFTGLEAYITAEFDDVCGNGNLLDDFDTLDAHGNAIFKPNTWVGGEFERKIEENNETNKMMLYTRGYGTRVHTRSILNAATDYLEATVRVDPSSWVEDTDGETTNRVRTRIEGRFFNDTYGPGQYHGNQGDVWTQIALDRWPGEDGSMSASCYAERYSDSTNDSPVEVFWHPFEMEIEPDHDYRLIIVKTDDEMVYAITDMETDPLITEIHTEDLPENVYEPYDNFRMLRTRVYDYGGGGEIKAYFDNVATEPGKVSGTITTPGDNAGTVYVVALPYTEADDWADQLALGDTEADPETGYYELYAPEGEYFIAAYQDVNGNGEREEDEPVGFVGNINFGPEIVYLSPEGTEQHFSIVYRPLFVATELERNRFPADEETPDWMPKGEVIMAEAEIGYGGSEGTFTVVLTYEGGEGSEVIGQLLDDGVFPDEIAGDNIFTGYVSRPEDPVVAGPYSFIVIDGYDVANQSDDQYIAGTSLLIRPEIESIDDYTSQPVTFKWEGVEGVEDVEYTLLIIDPVTEEPGITWHLELENVSSPLTLSEAVFEFEEGKEYQWLITASDAGGDNISISDLDTFTVYSPLAIPNAPETTPVVTSSGSFDFEAGGGSGSYTWAVDGPVSVPGGEGTSFTFTAPAEGTFAGDYTILLSDDETGWELEYHVYVPMKITPFSASTLETGFIDFTISGAPEGESFLCQIFDENGDPVVGRVNFDRGESLPTYTPSDYEELTTLRFSFTAQGELNGTPIETITTGDCWVVPVKDIYCRMVDAQSNVLLTPEVDEAEIHPLHDNISTPVFDEEKGWLISNVPQDGQTYSFFLMAEGYVSKTVTGAQICAGDILMEPIGGIYGGIEGNAVLKDSDFVDNVYVTLKD